MSAAAPAATVPAAVSTPRTPRHAIGFVFLTALLDMLGFGIVIPIMPHLLQQISGNTAAAALGLPNDPAT